MKVSLKILLLFDSYLLLGSLAFAEQPFFMAVGEPSDRVEGVSGDGSVVVGYLWPAEEAFRWTKDGGRVVLGGGAQRAFGISDDASVIVGRANFGSGTESFRWTGSGGATSLGDLPGGAFGGGIFNAVSGNGSVVVGDSLSASGREAFRWTAAGGMLGLGDLPGSEFHSEARAASSDGSVIVGFGDSSLGREAFRWTSSEGMVGLGGIPGNLNVGNAFLSSAQDISADGSVIVGWSRNVSGRTEAYRWTSGAGMAGLGYLPGPHGVSQAMAVSNDGSVIVGSSRPGDAITLNRAFIWDATRGMRDLNDVLTAEYGLNLNGWVLVQATDISADGRTIIGVGTNAVGFEASWIAHLGPAPEIGGDFNSDSSVDAADYVVWRKGLAIGSYTQIDYNTWRAYFGAPAAGAATGAHAPLQSAVPEPASLILLPVGLIGFATSRHRRRHAADLVEVSNSG